MSSSWTTQQVLALAPDASSAKAGQGLAAARKWQNQGQQDTVIWGEMQGSGSQPYRVRVDLQGPAYNCSCPSRKIPCKHSLGLMLLYANQADALPTQEPPPWVGDWIAGRSKRAEQKQQRVEKQASEAADPAAQAKRAAKREALVNAGLDELELRLHDSLRLGLSDQQRWREACHQAAARLVDAQAPALANQLLDLANSRFSGRAQQQLILQRLGRMQLLIEAWRQRALLPEALQHDIRSLIGWTIDQEQLRTQAGVLDCWIVVGQQEREEPNNLRQQRTWLWGLTTRQPALLLAFAHGGMSFKTPLYVGQRLDAELVYFPSAAPQRAVLKQILHAHAPVPAYQLPNLEQALQQHQHALLAQPWLNEQLLALHQVQVCAAEQGWWIRASNGQGLPIHPAYESGWELLALSREQPLELFTLWDGQYALPLNALQHGEAIL